MAKRFISPDWKQLRQFPEHLQRAWFYLWDKADACGVYHYDPDYLKLDLRLDTAPTLSELSALPDCDLLSCERILLTNFIEVNYVALKENYNPHKPAFRDLAKNKLSLNSSLNQACVKLEEEDKDEEEDLGRGAGEPFAHAPLSQPVFKSPPKGTAVVPSTNPPSAQAFQQFWTAYGKEVALHECQQEWWSMTPDERQLALIRAPEYVASLTDPQYHMNPLKWLQGKRWNDKPKPRGPVTVAQINDQHHKTIWGE